MGKRRETDLRIELEEEPDKQEIERFWVEKICRILEDEIASREEQRRLPERMKQKLESEKPV